MICHDSNQLLQALEIMRTGAEHSINLGCGTVQFDNSINCDLKGEVDIRLDAQKLPFADSSLDMIEAHHLLEHFGHQETENILNEWRRCLKSNGIFVISVPDCEVMFAVGLSDRTKAIPAKERWNALSAYVFGNQEDEGQYHKAGFAPEQLKQILIDTGFTIQGVWRGFPPRPTPSFCIIANKTQEEVQ
jgi:predicted SAM-dependent methyltransferase